MKRSFSIEEVINIVKNSNYFDNLSLVEAVQLREDIFDLKEMLCSKCVEKVFFDKSLNRWIAKYNKDYCKRFGIHEENGRLVLPLWIGNILNGVCENET